MITEDLAQWQPKVGDWCWFCDGTSAPILSQFTEMYSKTGYFGTHEFHTINGYKAKDFKSSYGFTGPKEEDYIFKFCEPFIGQLPSFVKETK